MIKVGDDVTPRDPKGKEAMKKSTFQSELGGTAACMKRMAIATKVCGQLTSNDTYFADSWFSSL